MNKLYFSTHGYGELLSQSVSLPIELERLLPSSLTLCYGFFPIIHSGCFLSPISTLKGVSLQFYQDPDSADYLIFSTSMKIIHISLATLESNHTKNRI